ncbi:MAG: site-specific integrase [Fluviicola sp.]
MSTNQKFNLLIYPNKQRSKNGLTPLYVRIYVDGKRSEFATNHKINFKDWDKANTRLKNSSPKAYAINNYIDETKVQLNKLFALASLSGEMTTPVELKNKFLGKEDKPQTKTLCDAIEYHNTKMREKVTAGLVSSATLLKYEIMKSKVVEFMLQRFRKDDIPLEELKFAFVTEFEHYLLTQDKLQSNTAYKYIKNLKRVLNIAVGNEWIQANPFAQFKCSYKSPERIVLTQQEVHTLIETEIKLPRLAEVRDVFVFCCYTGFAYSEVHKFKREDLSIGIDGETWLTTYRKKSGERESVPLLPIAMQIIERYKENDYCKQHGKLLPVNSNQRYNAYLKEVATLCGINKKLTTHIARHTFATTITLSNGVPIETVSKMLGHSKLATTQIYAKVLDRKVSDDMQVLKNKLHGDQEKTRLKITT